MRLCASNDNSTSIDTIPSGTILIIKEIQLRYDSACVYYVRVESVDGKYKGWVSLSSSHYELYIRGEKVVNEWRDESGFCPSRVYIAKDKIFDENGITYNF